MWSKTLLNAKPGCSDFWVADALSEKSMMCKPQNLDPSVQKPPWTISCCGTLHVDTGSPEHSSSCMNSSGAYFTFCPSLCLYHSAFLLLKLCHHRRRQRAWQFSLSLISRHRLSVAWLILVSPFKLGFSLKQGAVGSYQCGPFSYT